MRGVGMNPKIIKAIAVTAELTCAELSEAAIRVMLAGRACTQRVEETIGRLSSPQLG